MNSSTMFSSVFAVVQSPVPRCPRSLVSAALTTSSSAKQLHLQFLLLTPCSRTPATLQCRALSLSTSLRIVHLTHLFLLDMNSRRLCCTSTLVTFRHLDTGYHRPQSPCVSHLNRHVLAATSLVWPITLARHLVHLGNVIRRTCLLHSPLLLNTEASCNQLLLFAD